LFLLALSAVGLVACGGPKHAGRVTTDLSLDTTTVPAGTTIKGYLVVHNPGPQIDLNTVGGGPLHCHPGFGVTLSSPTVPPQEPAFAADCSSAKLLVGHGTVRLAVTVITTYESCTNDPSGVSRRTPSCDADGMPKLPPGTYTATVEWSDKAPLPAPPPVMVTLTA
jgi:hypothetical protein